MAHVIVSFDSPSTYHGRMHNFEPPEHLVILQTDHWIINHRVDSALPGYLMLGARAPTNDLSTLPPEALSQLGSLLARAQNSLNAILTPEHLYIGRYGHTAGHSLHFHMIPICGWVKRSFLGDPRYRVLQGFYQPSDAGAAADETDGAEFTLYVWREFCENPNPPPISGPPIQDIIDALKVLMAPSESPAPSHRPGGQIP
jgi:diadenosine tetraphosphate (Ap4A) HIT family hydrolase